MHKKWLLLSLVSLLLIIFFAACGQTTAETTGDTTDTEALIVERCGSCHSADRVFNANYTQEEWSNVFDSMIAKGANVNQEEKATMIDWLVSQE